MSGKTMQGRRGEKIIWEHFFLSITFSLQCPKWLYLESGREKKKTSIMLPSLLPVFHPNRTLAHRTKSQSAKVTGLPSQLTWTLFCASTDRAWSSILKRFQRSWGGCLARHIARAYPQQPPEKFSYNAKGGWINLGERDCFCLAYSAVHKDSLSYGELSSWLVAGFSMIVFCCCCL